MVEEIKFTADTPINRNNLTALLNATGTTVAALDVQYVNTMADILRVDEGKCTPTTAAETLKAVGARDMARAILRLVQPQ